MRGALLIILITALGIGEVEARRHGHHRHHHSRYVIQRYAPAPMLSGRRYLPPPQTDGATPSAHHEPPGQLVPPGWQLQPPDPNWNGRIYLSPDATASVTFYSRPRHQQPIAEKIKAFAFFDGEEINYLRAERDSIVVSGLKGDRMFYRKAVLACGGNSWHNMAFDYPVGVKSSMDDIVAHAARALDDHENTDCEPPVSSR